MRNNYTRQEELQKLIQFLQAGGMTHDDIYEEFGWSRKTAERMLNHIDSLYPNSFHREYVGADPRSRKKKYFLTVPDISKRLGVNIKYNEIAALHTAAEMVRNNDALSRTLKYIAIKLENLNRVARMDATDMMSSTGTVSKPGPHVSQDADILDKLQTAVLMYSKVKIKYHGSVRTVWPLGFLWGLHKNYLIATNSKHPNDPAEYKLNEIESVKILDSFFDANGFDMQAYASRSFGAYMDKELYDIEWRVLPSAVADARQYVFHPSQEMIDNPDGTMTIKMHACGLREMAWHLFTWNGTIIPVSPTKLVDIYREYIDNALKSLDK